MGKKSKENEQTLEELNSAHRCSQAKCQLIQTSYIKWITVFLFSPYNQHLINQAKSFCLGESWSWSCVSYDLGQDSSCSVNKSYNVMNDIIPFYMYSQNITFLSSKYMY